MKKGKLIDIIAYILIVIAAMVAVLIGGCVQREYEYDPKTGVFHVKTNYVASDTEADYIRIKTPSGILIEVNRVKQDNDSVKVIVPPYGVVETK